jgi:chemotaxis protein CheD
MLIRSMRNRGASIGSMEAKVFGGCNSWEGDHTMFSVGRRNIEVAVALIEEAGIRIVAQQTGGNYGRKIIFNTQTGKVRMFILNRLAAEVNEAISRGFGY